MNKRYLRIISLFLAVVLTLQVTGVLEVVTYAEKTSDESASGMIAEIATEPEIIGEDISKREEAVKHFKMSDGTWLAVAYTDAVHYQAPDGSWQEINNTLQSDTLEISVPMVAMTGQEVAVASVEGQAEAELAVNGSMEISDASYVNTSNNFSVSLPNILNDQAWVGAFYDDHSLYFRFENIDSSIATVANPTEQENNLQDELLAATHVNTNSSITYSDVLPGVDVTYTLTGQQLKENILFNALETAPDSLSYVIWAEDLDLEELEDGSFAFTDDNKQCFVIPAPFMMDSEGESSGSVEVLTEDIGEDTYRFTYVLDREWLESEDRVWPVVLDPVACADAIRHYIRDSYTRSGYPNNNYQNAYYFYTGYFSSATKNVRAYIKHNASPELDSGDVVTQALFMANGHISDGSGSMRITAHAITSDWDSSTVTWNNSPSIDDKILDFQVVDSTSYKMYSWDITSLAQRWYSGDVAEQGQLANNGIMLMAPDDENTGTVHLAQFNSSDGSGIWPQLLIYYRNTSGLESYWDYTSGSVGRAGTVSVNNYTGNLVVSRTDMAYSGNRMPASMSFTYNANDYDINIGYGNGWRSNYAQTIVPVTIGIFNYYCWTDGDGTRIYFYDDSGTWKDENGLEYTLTVETSGYKLQDRDNNQMIFDSNGRLTEVIDGKISNNKIQIAYVSGVTTPKIETITDGADRNYSFAYGSDGNLKSITYLGANSTAVETVSYTYTNNQLDEVKYADGLKAAYLYSSGFLTEAAGCQSDSATIEYSTGITNKVSDFIIKDSTTTVSSANFKYGDNYTKVTDNNSRWCVYQFNNWGNTVSVYNQRGQALYGTYSEATPNQLVNSSRLQDTVTNLLDARSHSSSWNQSVNVTDGKTYTLSGTGSGTATKKLKITVNGTTYESDSVTTERAEVTAVVPSGVTTLTISGTGGFKDLQLEQTESASRYNMLNDMDMTDISSWTGSGTTAGDGLSSSDGLRAHLNNAALLINGSGTTTKQYTQTLDVSGSLGDNYSFGVWVKATSVALDNVNTPEDTGHKRRFGVQVRLLNGSTVVAEKYIAANDACAEWQFISGSVQATGAYTKVEYALVYDYNANCAYFDGAQLFYERFGYVYKYDENGRISTVTDLDGNETEYTYRDSSSDITKIKLTNGAEYCYTYNDSNLLTGTTSATGVQTSYDYDAYGNVLETTISYADNTGPVIQSNQTYTTDGNFLATVTGSDRNTVTYTYDTNNSTLSSVKDAKETATTYTYDSMRRLKSSTTGEMSVAYTYNIDRLNSITHTGGANSTVYSFAYTTAGLTDTVTVGNTYKLVDNAYNSGTWTLASQTYGNGDVWHYTYNEFDDLVSSYSINKNNPTEGTELKYFYNSEGALARIEQYDTTLSGGSITARSLVSTERYYYDTADRMIRITRTDTDGDTYECSWEYDHNDNVTSLIETINDETLTTSYSYDNDQRITAVTTSHSDSASSGANYTYDSVGRLSQQITKNNGSDVITKAITYRTLDSTFTTEQVATQKLSAANYNVTYTYTYDANGNITSISDGINTTSYVYDTANQLIRENNQAAGATWIWTYDNGGNILSRSEYDYTLAEQPGGGEVTGTYVYGNTAWGDLLTAYNGQALTHDDIGNLTDDGTWKYGWQNGRQLASMEGEDVSGGDNDVTIDYAYDADGLRTRKTVTTTSYSDHAHSYTATVVAATCVQDGYTLYECSCGDHYRIAGSEATGHFIPATICTRCGAAYCDHSHTTTVVQPTCTEDGYTLHTCTKCAESYRDTWTDDTGHYYATTTSTLCTRCGYNRGTVSAASPVSTEVQYSYVYSGDALMQMTAKTTVENGTPSTQTLNFVYDANGSPMAVSYNNATYYYVTNTQGDVTAILNTSGTAVVKYTYDAWGSILRIDDTTSFSLGTLNPLRYRGYVYDSETGLYYVSSRYYDPEIGRWINADSVIAGVGGSIQGYNTFAYCFNNPVNMSDSSGHWPHWMKDVADWVNNNIIQPVANFFSPNTNTIGGSFQEGPFIGSGSLTGGYSEIMLRGQGDKKVSPNSGEPSVTVGAFAKVSGGNAAGKIGVGNKDASLSLKGVGDVLTASAQAGLKYQGGLGLTAKAKAAVFSGRATVEFQLFSWQIELGVTGDAISAGAEATIGIFDGAFEANANASLGVGGGFVFRVKPG